MTTKTGQLASAENRKANRGPTWREIVREVFARSKDGVLSCSDIYAALDGHPKTKDHPTWRARIRRTLQEDETLESADGRGTWRLKAAETR